MSLTKYLGTYKVRTSPYHPSSNGIVERFHRSLKQSIRCHTALQGTDALPTVLLSLRSALKEDLNASSAKLAYGINLRLPGDFVHSFNPSTCNVDPVTFVHQLRNCMSKLRPVPASAHCKQTVFVHKELKNSSHIFLRCDALKPSLAPQYSGPHQVLARNEKTFKILVNEKETVVSIDRLMPAFSWTPEATGANASSPSQLPSQDSSLRQKPRLPTYQMLR
ncbi:uncharacterized protein LOC118183951 [Stegodyphus dumicola]|uniref:uncharacterized protein LOC118183951 n=1 Tax=Stegodyphus dumicola TaxID=202533 RepID=UPI0015B33B02|nr:uncharacterized protein LOC118183951 [Stegodyphus dumicola]